MNFDFCSGRQDAREWSGDTRECGFELHEVTDGVEGQQCGRVLERERERERKVEMAEACLARDNVCETVA